MKKLLSIGMFLLFSFSPAFGDELEDAVAKLIIDFHNLKISNLKLQQEVNRLKQQVDSLQEVVKQIQNRHATVGKQNTRRQKEINEQLPNCSFTVIRGKVQFSRKSCALATLTKRSSKEEEYLTSVLPESVPIYVKRYKNYCVYLTLPEYCKQVKEKIKDAFITHIPLSGNTVNADSK